MTDGTSKAGTHAGYRLIAICLLVGVIGAFAALAFDAAVDLAQRNLLERIADYKPPAVGTLNPVAESPDWDLRWWLPLVTTLGGLIGGFLVYTFAPEAEGHGTDAAIASYHQRAGAIRGRVPLIKAVASALTIGSGGVAGREGPTAQISVGIGSWIGQKLRLRGQDRRIVLLASMSGGLAAVFGSPLGMAIFSVEILYAGMVFESEALIYTVISAVTAYAVHGFFAGWTPIFAIPGGLGFRSPETLIGYAALGVLAGLVGSALPTLFYGIRELFARIPCPKQVKPAIGGLLLGLLAIAFPPILGTGYGWVELAMAGNLSLLVMLALLLLKGPAMSLTIGSGGSGGVFGPTIVIGAMLGGIAGTVLSEIFPLADIAIASFVLVGMAATFAGAARTPISTLIMVAEMTGGYGLIVPSMLANVISFMVQRSLTSGWRYPTLYVSQVMSREDSPVHRGVFVRRALRMIEDGVIDASDFTLPQLVSLLQYGEPIPVTHGSAMLVGLTVEEGSTLAEKTIAEGVGKIPGVTAVAVLRESTMLVPRGPTRLHAGDQLVAVAATEGFETLKSQSRRAADFSLG